MTAWGRSRSASWLVAAMLAGCSFSIGAAPGDADPDAGDGGGGGGGDAPDAMPVPLTCTLALGSDHSCVRKTTDATLWCWGDNGVGQLGAAVGSTSVNAVQVPLGQATPAAASRFFHTCAARADGSVVCWGLNDRLQLGDGTFTTRPSPTVVTGLTDVVALATGRSLSCARRGAGSVTCWGENTGGGLGDGTNTNRSTPATDVVDLPAPPLQLVVGSGHACVLLPGATGRCWGGNAFGQLGDGTTTDRNRPVPMPVTGITAIATNGYSVGGGFSGAQTCVIKTDRTVWCWGSNEFGQLGNGATSAPVGTPGQVGGIDDAVEIAMGRYHTCVRSAAGAVACWGRNEGGQIGDTTFTSRPTPFTVPLPAPAIHVAAGGYHTCAMLADRALWCWGANARGQLGDGTFVARTTPVASKTLCQ